VHDSKGDHILLPIKLRNSTPIFLEREGKIASAARLEVR
jgi:hypothetical protein